MVGMGELSRNPTVKEEIKLPGARPWWADDDGTRCISRGCAVLQGGSRPVGRDQLPHLEFDSNRSRGAFNDR